MTDVQRWVAAVEANIQTRLPGYHVSWGRGLATLVVVLLKAHEGVKSDKRS